MTLLLALIASLAQAAPPAPPVTDSLLNELKVCDRYQALENRLRCDLRGYLMGTGFPLCQEYVRENANFSPEGQAVVAKIRRCLVKKLDAQLERLSCLNVEDIGFSSHPGCYVESGYCGLSAHDKWVVLRVGVRVFLNPRAWVQYPEIQRLCQEAR